MRLKRLRGTANSGSKASNRGSGKQAKVQDREDSTRADAGASLLISRLTCASICRRCPDEPNASDAAS